MAATSHFASASLSMPVSIRVEVFDSRASASKKKGTPLAKFRMRTPASTTFGNLGGAVAERYMKESAGTITVSPRVVCVLDMEDCTFDLDDSIDIVVPNEAVRFVLDRGSGAMPQQPVLPSRNVQQPQVNGHDSSHVNGHTSAQSSRAPFPASRQPALLQQRLATAPAVAQVPLPASPPTGHPTKLTSGSNEQHKSTPQSPGLSSKKRDPYDIDSEEDANDPPSRHSSSQAPQPSSLAPRSSKPSATKPGRGQPNEAHLSNGNGKVSTARSQARREELAPSAIETPQRPANPDEKALSRERSIKQVEAGAEVLSVNGTDSKGAPSPIQQHVPSNHVPLSQSSRRSVVPPGADVVSIADSGSHDDSDSDDIRSPPRLPTQRSLEKRSYHTVNEHVNIENRHRSSSRNVDPTPILLKNSRGIFPIYRKGEAPSSEFGGPLSEELGNAQPFLSRSGGPHTVPRKLPTTANANGISQGPRSDPVSWDNFEEEFAGFDELSDFEIAPPARTTTSQPNHRTQTPSRSSMKTAREPGSGRNPFSSMQPRSSPLESKQARLPHARERGGTVATSATRSTQSLTQPQRGSNNRASREPSVVELLEAPTSSFPRQPRAAPAVKPAAASSQSRGIGGNDIRQWIASRRSSNPEPVKPSPAPTTAAVRPLKPSQAIRKVKSMTEMKMKPKAKSSTAQVPEVFYVEDDVRTDVYNSATSSIEIPDDEPALPRQKPPTSAQRAPFSRASSCVSSQSGHAGSKRGRIPSSPFYPIDDLNAQDRQQSADSAPQQHFGRGYSRRVRAIFSDASESSDGDAKDESARDRKPKPLQPTAVIKPPDNNIRKENNESPRDHATRSETPTPVISGSKVILTAQRTSHPKWKPWWHAWGWTNRYETEFFVGGIIANGPFEGYHLTNEKAGVYIEGCEAPTEDLLAAEDLTCKKDETRLMQRRERRRTRRLAGDFRKHEDDGFDSDEELAREFGENDDICKGLSIANEIEISCTMDTDSELDGESSSSSSSEESREAIDMKESVPFSNPNAPPRQEESESDESGEEEEESVQKLPLSTKSPLKQAVLDDKVAEKHVRMERARQYALTGEVSSQSQSQDELEATSHEEAETKSLTRASEANSAHSTTTSVLIARQLGVSSPPSNQELAILMSSSPTKAPQKSGLGELEDDDSGAGEGSDSNMASIPARLPSPQVNIQSSESQVEVRETPIKTRPRSDKVANQSVSVQGIHENPDSGAETDMPGRDINKSPSPEIEDITEAVRSAKRRKEKKESKNKDKKYKMLTKPSTPKPNAELVVELPSMSQEQRSSYSETRPTASTPTPPPPQLRSFENLNAVGTNDVSSRKRASTPVIISDDDDDDDVLYVLRESPKWLNSNLQITSPIMSFARLTGDSDHEDDAVNMSPTVARSQRKRRVTFGDDLETISTKTLALPESQSSKKSPTDNSRQRALDSSDVDPVHAVSTKSKSYKSRRGSQQSPVASKEKPVDASPEAEDPHVEASPPKSSPPKAKRVPVVSFAVSDSEEDNIVLSLDGLPNVVEDVQLRKEVTSAKGSKTALSQRAVTPVPPPSIPVNFSVLPAPPKAPMSWPRPRVVTPVPPPVIPPTSDSDLYKTRPQVIEIDSTEPSNSKGDSDVVMIPRPLTQSPPPAVRSSQVPTSTPSRKLKLEATAQNEPAPSPEPVLPVIYPRDNLIDEPFRELEATSPAVEEKGVKEERPKKEFKSRARRKAEKARRKKDHKERRLSSRRNNNNSNTVHAAALVASPRTRTIITSMDKASGGRRRSSGNFQPVFEAQPPVIGKKGRRSQRRESLRALPGGSGDVDSPVHHGDVPSKGQKRKSRRDSNDGQQQQVDIRTNDYNGAPSEGILAEAVKRAKKRKLGDGPVDNIIKREKKVNGAGGGFAALGKGPVDDGGFLESSSSHGNVSSSHPSLISPPTTSRPSSAGSRGSR